MAHNPQLGLIGHRLKLVAHGGLAGEQRARSRCGCRRRRDCHHIRLHPKALKSHIGTCLISGIARGGPFSDIVGDTRREQPAGAHRQPQSHARHAQEPEGADTPSPIRSLGAGEPEEGPEERRQRCDDTTDNLSDRQPEQDTDQHTEPAPRSHFGQRRNPLLLMGRRRIARCECRQRALRSYRLRDVGPDRFIGWHALVPRRN
jgi:hypothetical protein